MGDRSSSGSAALGPLEDGAWLALLSVVWSLACIAFVDWLFHDDARAA